jgi:hypothetical protein
VDHAGGRPGPRHPRGGRWGDQACRGSLRRRWCVPAVPR